MTYYLVRLQHNHIIPEYGTIWDDDPYDHYLGETNERTNLRFVIVDDAGLSELNDAYIQDDPFNYESINVMWEFYYEHEVKRFLKCMREISVVK